MVALPSNGGFSDLVDNSFRGLPPGLPPIPEIVDLLGKAFLIQSIAGLPDITMIDVVKTHLNSSEPEILNKTIVDRFPSISNPWSTLKELDVLLPQLPQDNTGPTRSIAFLCMTIAAAIVVALRFYVRKFVTPKEIRREDWWCLVALFWTIAIATTMYVGTFYGTGRHIWTLTLTEIKNCAKVTMANEYCFLIGHWFIKFNFLVFYYRLSPDAKYRMCVKLVGVYVCNMTLVAFFVVTFQCKPVAWWTALDSANCVNRLLAFQFHGAGMILADFLILALPMPMVWKLKLQLVEKIALAGVFALGAVISVVGIIRVVALKDWLASNDWPYDGNCPWIVLEIALSVIVSCAPAIKRLFFHKSGEVRGLSKVTWTAGGMFRPTRAAAVRARGRGDSFFKSTFRATVRTRNEEGDDRIERITELAEYTDSDGSKNRSRSDGSHGGTTTDRSEKYYGEEKENHEFQVRRLGTGSTVQNDRGGIERLGKVDGK